MKITIKELRAMIANEINEAKKKKKTKKEKDAEKLQPKGYEQDPVFDFSQPQGDKNLYKRQGASVIGPFTSEGALKILVRECVRAELSGKVNENTIGFKQLKSLFAKNEGLSAAIGRKGSSAQTRTAVVGKKKTK